MSQPSNCPHCQASQPAGTRFCGECGKSLDAQAPAAKPAAKTMIGLDSAAMAAAMEQAKAKAAAPPAQPAASGASAKLPAKTMLGMSLPTAPVAEPKQDPKPPAGPLLGAGGGRTMLGVPLSATAPETPAASPPAASPAHTMLDAFGPPDDAPLSATGSRQAEIDTDMSLPKPRARPAWLVPLVVLAVAALAAGLLLRSRGGRSDVTAKIVTIDTGEALLFEVPRAAAGSKIRFGGQEKPLQAGRATFSLASDSLRVGDNVVLADVVYPDGEIDPQRITLAVFYRLWVDTAALRNDKSQVDVVVTALPGTRVTLDGQDVKLDAEGRATRSYPIDVVTEAKAGVIEHVVSYRIQPPAGETVVDALHTQIPVAMMQIDRPGRRLVTDRDSVEIAGAADRSAKVTVNGTEVATRDGRFLYRLSLPAAGEYKPRVIASAAGKAPMGVTLEIRRVADLASAASDFAADPDLTYAKLAPNPAIYRGQKIALEGRVYATDPRGGASVIQMLARPCPGSQRCSVWVDDPTGAEVSVDSWVRVLGTVEGEQQFRSEKNDVVTVPKLQAQFILPAKP